jgi:hypothetical protein
MPGAFGGNVITSSTQLGAGVVDANAIATDGVDTAEIKSQAVGTDEIQNLSIVDGDISASAAIVDTKLATISTAGKVSGAALTSLASVPAGAGVLPSANLPGGAVLVPQVTVVSSITATDLLNYSIAGGTLGAANVVRFKIPIWAIKKAGAAASNAIQLKYGATNLITINPDNNAATFTDDRGYIEGEIWGDGSTSAQRAVIKISHGLDNNATAPTQWWTCSLSGTSAIDSTTAQTLRVVWSNGTNSANDYIKTGVGVIDKVS